MIFSGRFTLWADSRWEVRRCASDLSGKCRLLLRREAGCGAGPENSGGDPGLLDAGGPHHNTHVVNDLAARGVRKTDRPETLAAGDTVVIRSHGELKSVLDGLAAPGRPAA